MDIVESKTGSVSKTELENWSTCESESEGFLLPLGRGELERKTSLLLLLLLVHPHHPQQRWRSLWKEVWGLGAAVRLQATNPLLAAAGGTPVGWLAVVIRYGWMVVIGIGIHGSWQPFVHILEDEEVVVFTQLKSVVTNFLISSLWNLVFYHHSQPPPLLWSSYYHQQQHISGFSSTTPLFALWL